nr:hypothetical protein [Paenibacillus sp. 79R4]
MITAKTNGLQKAMAAVTNRFKGAEQAARDVTAAVDTQGKQAADTSNKMKSLSESLANTNQQIELQKQKIAGLKAEQANLTAVAQQQMQALEKESYSLEEQIRSTTEKLGAMKAEQAKAMSPVHADMMTEEISQVEKSLTDLIAKADEVGNKMADLDASGGNQKLQQSIAKAEGTLISLEQRADSTRSSMEKLMIVPIKPAKQTVTAVQEVDKAVKETGKNARKTSNQFVSAFKRIAKQVLVFALIYKAIRGVSKYIGDSLKTNEQYAASLNAIQTNLRVAFQPIYQAILPAINAFMNALAKITAYIAAFISALFGKTYKQSYDAAKGLESARKAMAGYGKAAKKSGKDAKLAMASFDQLNTLDFSKDSDKDSGGADDGFSMQMPDMDIDGIQSKMDKLAAGVKSTFDKAWQGVKSGWDWTVKTFGPSFQSAWSEISPTLDRWKEQFKTMFEDVKSLGAPLGEWFKTDLVKNMQEGIQLAGHVWAGLSDSAQKVVASLWEAVFPILDKFVTEGLPRISEFVTGAQEIFRKMFDLVKQIFDDIWRDAVDPAMKLVSQIIQDTMDIVYEWWDKWGKKIVDKLKEALDGIKNLWSNLWDNFLKPFITNMLKKLEELWDKHLKGLVEEVGNFVGKLASAALDIFNKFILPIVNWLVKTLGPTFSEVFTFLGGVLVTAIGAVIDFTKGIIKALGGLMDFIAGVFTGDWKRAWEGVKTVFSGIWDGIVGILKGAVNIIIDAINFLIQQLNKIKIDVPEWVGKIPGVPDDIGTIGFSIPKIPRLAVGTNYVASDGLAYLHEGEAVVPKRYNPAAGGGGDNKETNALLKQLIQAVKDGATVVIGRDEVGRAAVGYMNDFQRQTGRPAISL